jgi:3D-(3,5/4)-trihydroxycyclohexane-1,2-dione acylhydrolase (decyclizing)
MSIRLTAAQAMIRYLAAQRADDGTPYFLGCWAIFGHGNVAGIGEALYEHRKDFPTWRSHNEQSMALAAVAYGKATGRRHAMAATSSIGPGALNMVTAAGVAHVDRLPVLLIPGDVFANRAPDPVLQQIEPYHDGTISVNDAFKPVSRYFDRIMRPEQLLSALPRAMAVLTDPAECGPVTLAFPQDVQTEAFDYPEAFFEPKVWHQRRIRPDVEELAAVAKVLKGAKAPVIVAGGGVHYSDAFEALSAFATKHGIPVVETQAGKSALPWDHAMNLGSVGVTGTGCANDVAEAADVVVGVGTRFQDFTTGSWALFKAKGRTLVSLNVATFDATKRGAMPLLADARAGLEELSAALGGWKAGGVPKGAKEAWFARVDPLTAAPKDGNQLPTDQQIIGAVQRASGPDTVVLNAAGSMPGELHKLWKAGRPRSYHMEYGFSCMGYEIPAAIAIKMADPDREVLCFVGDGTYMMMNSDLATAAGMGLKMTLIITDNGGYGCINRLQKATGGEEFNNLIKDTQVADMRIDYAAHAASMGAEAVSVSSIAELEAALARARTAKGPFVAVIKSDPYTVTPFGGHWWDVAVPEVSTRSQVDEARASYEKHLKSRAQ